jgi:hypothetical protein
MDADSFGAGVHLLCYHSHTLPSLDRSALFNRLVIVVFHHVAAEDGRKK